MLLPTSRSSNSLIIRVAGRVTFQVAIGQVAPVPPFPAVGIPMLPLPLPAPLPLQNAPLPPVGVDGAAIPAPPPLPNNTPNNNANNGSNGSDVKTLLSSISSRQPTLVSIFIRRQRSLRERLAAFDYARALSISLWLYHGMRWLRSRTSILLPISCHRSTRSTPSKLGYHIAMFGGYITAVSLVDLIMTLPPSIWQLPSQPSSSSSSSSTSLVPTSVSKIWQRLQSHLYTYHSPVTWTDVITNGINNGMNGMICEIRGRFVMVGTFVLVATLLRRYDDLSTIYGWIDII
jgi:hypothetical protein